MAEVLMQLVAKPGASATMAFGAGDVIAVQVDGWGWSSAELTNPQWLVVKLPGVDPTLLSDMLAPASVSNSIPGSDPNQQIAVLKRAKYINLALPAIQTFLATAVNGTVTVPANKITVFNAAKVIKTVPAQVVLG